MNDEQLESEKTPVEDNDTSQEVVLPASVIDENLLPPRQVISFEQRRKLSRLAYFEAWAWYQALFYWIPGRVGWLIRRLMYRPFFQKVGRGWHIAEFCSIQPPNRFQIGHKCAVSRYAIVNAMGGVILGDYSGIGPFTQVISVTHNFRKLKDLNVPFGAQPRILETAPIIIKSNVWIGAGCVILPGVTIGPNSIVVAGSTVHKDVPPYSMAGGVPARIIRRTSREEIEEQGDEFVLRRVVKQKK